MSETSQPLPVCTIVTSARYGVMEVPPEAFVAALSTTQPTEKSGKK